MNKFPLYLMKIDEEFKFYPIHEAAAWFDNGYVRVDFGGFVLLDDKMTVRRITDAEKNKISDMADEYSARK